MTTHLLSGLEIAAEKLKDDLSGIKTAMLKSAAAAFQKNVANVSDLLDLPSAMLTHGSTKTWQTVL